MNSSRKASRQDIERLRASITITLYGLAEVRKHLKGTTDDFILSAASQLAEIKPLTFDIPALPSAALDWADIKNQVRKKYENDPTGIAAGVINTAIDLASRIVNPIVSGFTTAANNILGMAREGKKLFDGIGKFLDSIDQMAENRDKLRAQETTLENQLREYQEQIDELLQQEEAALSTRREQYNRPLLPGEAVLYEQVNFGGDVLGAQGDLFDVNSDMNSLRLGSGTGATVYSGACFTGVEQEIPVSVTSFEKSKLQGAYPRSIKIWSMDDRPFTGKWAIKIAKISAEGTANQQLPAETYLSVKSGDNNVGIATITSRITANETFYIRNLESERDDRWLVTFELPGMSFTPASQARKRPWSMTFDSLQRVYLVQERGYRQFSLVTKNNKWVRYSDDADQVFYLNDYEDERTIFTLAVKLADDETQVGALEPGEIALYENPVYWGRAWVLHAEHPDFTAVEGLNDSISSIRLGPGTAATVFQHTQYGGTMMDVVTDVQDAALVQIGDNVISSIRPWRIVPPEQYGVRTNAVLSQDYAVTPASQDGTSTNVQDITVYRVTLELPSAQEDRVLRIWTTDTATITVSNVQYQTDEMNHAEFVLVGTDPAQNTGANGNLSDLIKRLKSPLINITMHADKLTAPGVKVHFDGMQPDERFVIFPDQSTQARLLEKSASDFAQAQDGNGKFLFVPPDELTLDDKYADKYREAMGHVVYDVIQNTLPLVARPGVPAHTSASANGANQPTPSARSNGTNKAHGKRGAWKLSFADSAARTTPSFKMLSTDQALAESTSASALAIGIAPMSIIDSSFNEVANWFNSIGDAAGDWFTITMDDIKNAVMEGVDFIVLQTRGALQVIIKGFENEVLKPLKNLVLSTVEAVTTFVETIIEKIGAKLEEFLAWLRLVFDWDNIRQTRDVLKRLANDSFAQLETWTLAAKDPVKRFFADQRSLIEDKLNALITELGGTPTDPTQVRPPKALSQISETLDWLLGKVFDYWEDLIPDGFGYSPTAEEENELETFLKKINERVGSVVGSSAGIINDVINLLGTDPRQYINQPELLAAGLLNILKNIVLTGLTAAEGLLDIVIDLVALLIRLFKKMLNYELNIPVLADLYRTVTGDALSLMSLGTTLLAIPVTVLLGGPLDDSLVQRSLPAQAQALMVEARLMDSSASAQDAPAVQMANVQAASAQEKKMSAIEKATKSIQISASLIGGMIDTVLDTFTLPEGMDPSSKGVLKVAKLSGKPQTGLEITSFILSFIAWSADAPSGTWFLPHAGHYGTDDGTPEYWENVIWFYEMGGLVLDLIFMIPMGERARRAEVIGTVASGVYAAAELGLVSKLADVRLKKATTEQERHEAHVENLGNFMGLWPSLFAFLRIKEIVEPTYGITQVVVGALDQAAAWTTFGTGVEELAKG
jgi:hypothetical protein